jgi:hypothetical protein
MYYHTLFELADKHQQMVNYPLDDLLNELIIPFINKQVLAVELGDRTEIINLGTVSYVRVFKTQFGIESMDKNGELTLTTTEFQKYDCTSEVTAVALQNASLGKLTSIVEKILLPTKKQVFVIMKFRDRVLDSAYVGAIRPVFKRFKYDVLRIDEIQDSGKITDQILEEIARSELVIADLTDERPNCYYEAGFAHAIGKEIIFTIKKGSSIHFDLAGYRFIEWETEEDLRQLLKQRLASKAKKLSRNPR